MFDKKLHNSKISVNVVTKDILERLWHFCLMFSVL